MPIQFKVEEQPETLEAAVDLIVANLDDDEREYLRAEGFAGLHFTVGMAMRNGWNLWGAQDRNPKTLHDHVMNRFGESWSKCPGDDIAGLIYRGVEARLRGEPFDPIAYIAKTRWFYASQEQ